MKEDEYQAEVLRLLKEIKAAQDKANEFLSWIATK